MRKPLITLLGFLFALTAVADSGIVPSNTLKVGDGTASDKQIVLNKGAGASNPRIKWNQGTSKIQFSNDGALFKDIGSGSGSGTGGIQLMTDNPDFEGTLANWSASSAPTLTLAVTGSNLLFGLGSGVFTATGSSQTVTAGAVAVPNGLIGNAGSASCTFLTAASVYKIQALQGATVVGEAVIPASTTPVTVAAPFPLKAGSFALRVISTGAGSALAMDNCFLGSSALTQLSQAQLVGTMTITGCTSGFNYTAGTWADATDTGCTYTGTGALSQPTTMWPGFKATLPAGEYLVEVDGAFILASASGVYGMRLSNGTFSSRGASKPWIAGTGSAEIGHEAFKISVPSSVSASDFRIQGTAYGSGLQISAQATNDLVFSVYKFPTLSEQAVSPAASAIAWSGSVTGNTTISVNTETDFAGTAAIGTEFSNRNIGTVTGAGTGLGVTWTPSRAGMWKICTHGDVGNATAGASQSFYLTDVANTHLTDPQSFTQSTGGGGSAPYNLCATVNIQAAASPYTVKLRAFVSTGSITAGSSSWSIENLDQGLGAPVFIGAVVTKSSGVEQLVRAKISACSSSPCTITSQSGGISSVTRSASGTYAIAFDAGAFSGAPSCSVQGTDSGPGIRLCYTGLPQTSTAVPFFCVDGAITNQDAAVDILCQGPK